MKNWFANAKVGLFTHYTYATYNGDVKINWGGTCKSSVDLVGADSLDQLADGFDAKRYAAMANAMAAQYVTFTVCHAGFNLLFPSKTMADAGCPAKASRRDLVGDLIDALSPYGIKLVLYMPPNDCHDLRDDELAILKWNDDAVRMTFNSRLVHEIFERYGKYVAGYWFDQGGPTQLVSDTIRADNPDAVIYINYGVTENEQFDAEKADLFVSEYYGQAPEGSSDSWKTHHSQISRIIGGEWWANGGKVKTTARELYRWTVRVIATEGQFNSGINWACSPYMSNEWEAGVEPLLIELGQFLRGHEGIFDTVPSNTFVTPTLSVLAKEQWGAATESMDGKVTFLHVLNLPETNELAVDLPVCGKGKFKDAFCGTLRAGVREDGDRLIITLPDGFARDAIDTVIRLS